MDVFGPIEEKENAQHKKAQESFRAEYPEEAKILDQWIDGLDFKVLRSIFEEYAVKSGVAPDRMNFISRDRVYLSPDLLPDKDFVYKMIANVVLLNGKNYAKLFSKEGSDSILIYIQFLQGISHEFSHVTAQSECVLREGKDQDDVSVSASRYVGGLHAKYTKMRDVSDIYDRKDVEAFSLLNEGITERISHEVLSEYIRRVPVASVDNMQQIVGLSLEIDLKDPLEKGYAIPRLLLVALTSVIAESTGVSESLVWRGFVQQYYAGELKPDQIADLLDDTLGKGFGRRLAFAKNKADLRELVLSSESVSDKYLEAAERWLALLKVTRGAH